MSGSAGDLHLQGAARLALHDGAADSGRLPGGLSVLRLRPPPPEHHQVKEGNRLRQKRLPHSLQLGSVPQ